MLSSIETVAEAQISTDEDGWTLGLGVVAETSPFVGAENLEITPIPYVAYDTGRLHLGIDGVAYGLIGSDNLEVDVLIEPRWTFVGPDSSPLFSHIDRGTAIEMGMDAELSLSGFHTGIKAMKDVSSQHEGYEVTLTTGYEFEAGSVLLDFGVGSSYRDSDLNNFLYGVSMSEARTNLTAFNPKSGWQPFIEATVLYPFGERTALVGFADYSLLSDEVKNSPLLERDNEATIGLVFIRKF